jgi:hypothetical protein
VNAEERAAFRAFVREHHPDRGGDPEVFAAGLARFGTRAPALPDPEPRPEPGPEPVDVSALPFPVRVGVALIRTWHHHRRSSRADPPADSP